MLDRVDTDTQDGCYLSIRDIPMRFQDRIDSPKSKQTSCLFQIRLLLQRLSQYPRGHKIKKLTKIILLQNKLRLSMQFPSASQVSIPNFQDQVCNLRSVDIIIIKNLKNSRLGFGFFQFKFPVRENFLVCVSIYLYIKSFTSFYILPTGFWGFGVIKRR